MKMYEVEIEVNVTKWMEVEALDEDDAIQKAYEICLNNPIPVLPDDVPVVDIIDVKEDHFDI